MFAATTLRAPTLAAQLRVCRSIDFKSPKKIDDGKPIEQRFEPAIWRSLSEAKEGFADHSRFTTRFGDILAIAAQSDPEKSKRNVDALLQHVDASSTQSSELAAELASMLSSPATRWRRRRALRATRAAHGAGGRDLASEGSLEASLYAQAQQAASPLLRGIGLSEDWIGLTVLIALARATAGRGSDEWRRLEVAITRHFSGVRHGRGGLALRSATDVGAISAAAASAATSAASAASAAAASAADASAASAASAASPAATSSRKRVLVVSFASRGVGLARFEFGSTIRALASRGALKDWHVL